MSTISWKSIEDLPEDFQELASPELESLAPIWQDQRGRLEKTGALSDFNARLRREWSIETGIIENLYSLDRGITEILIERGIEASLIPHGATDRPAEEIVAILKDHEDALDGLFDFVAHRRSLSTSYIKELHQVLARNQDAVAAIDETGRADSVPLIKGEWKQLPNNPTRPNGDIHEYCPPVHVAAEMDRLVALHQNHTAMKVPPDIEAAWLHHRFTQIHPFQDGNGRLARSLASLIMLRARWFPLVIDRDIRTQYLDCLESADAGDLAPLVQLFAEVEKHAFVKALNISEDVLKERVSLQQVISAAVERLQARFQGQLEKHKNVIVVSEKLKETARVKFTEVADQLKNEISQIQDQFNTSVDTNDETNSIWFRSQIVNLAKKYGYFADSGTYAAWVRLKIWEERPAEIVISFHSLGREFVGVVAASAFIEYRDRGEDGLVKVDGPYALSQSIFQCSFNESEKTVAKRFVGWLDEVILSGLDQWRRQL